MFGHADETDDFETGHQGAPRLRRRAGGARDGRAGRASGGSDRRLALGYDLCCRLLMALGPDHVAPRTAAPRKAQRDDRRRRGAASWHAWTKRACATRCRTPLSRSPASGAGSATSEHVEKAFDFAGMGARNGVTAALMVQLGFTGVGDVLDGEHNALDAHSREPKPEEMARDLGTRFFVTETAIKTFSVGYPIQAALDAFLSLRREHRSDARLRRSHRRHAARGRGAHRRQPIDAGRQPAVPDRGGAGRRHGVVRCQPLLRAHEGSGRCST